MTINYLLCENQNFISRKSKKSNEHLAEKLKKLRPWCRFDSLIYQPSDKRSCCAAQTSSTSCLCHSLVSLSVSFPPSPPEMCQAAQAGGTSQTKPELLAPLVKTKLKLLFPALTPSRSFTGCLFWLSNTQVDSELAACPAHKSEGGVAG